MRLSYIGMDSHNRPVYENENGYLFKDTDPRKDKTPRLTSAYNNAFDGEPDIPYDGDIEFLPARVTW